MMNAYNPDNECNRCMTYFECAEDGDLWITEWFPYESISLCGNCMRALGGSGVHTGSTDS